MPSKPKNGTVTSPKLRQIEPKTLPTPKQQPPGRPEIVDEFGRLGAKLDQMKPLVQRYEMLRAQISAWYNDSDPEGSYSDDGAEFSVQVGPRALRRSIADMAAIMDRIGEKTFLGLCTLSLEKLDTVMLPKDQERLVTSDRTGPRVVRAVAKFTQTTAA